jgi:hypothetical protein
MSELEGTIYCDGCGVEIPLSPIVIGQNQYCCLDCAHGLSCDCASLLELDEPKRGRTSFTSRMEIYS